MKYLLLLVITCTCLLSQQVTFSFSDGREGGSSGNEDGVINNFESILIKGFTLLDSTIQNVDIHPLLPEGLTLEDKVAVKTQDGYVAFSFYIYVSKRFSEDKVIFPISIIHNNKQIALFSFTAPFKGVDWEKKFFTEHPVDLKEKNENTKKVLDEYLRRFPDAANAQFVFRARFEYCRFFEQKGLAAKKEFSSATLSKTIVEYHDFIATYPNRELTRIALHNCYTLCRKLNSLEEYRKFLKRYPNSSYRIIVAQKVEYLEFQEVCEKNTIAHYENFILAHFSSSYVQPCLELALAKKVENERKLYGTAEVSKHMGNLMADAMETSDKKEREENKHKRFILSCRLKRIADTAHEIFRRVKPRDVMLIRYLVKFNELQDSIDEHFRKQNENLQRQLKKLDASIKSYLSNIKFVIQKDIKNLHTSVKNMHNDLKKDVHKLGKDIEDVKTMMKVRFDNIDNHLQSIDRKLDVIHEKVIEIAENQEQPVDDFFNTLPGVNIVYTGLKVVLSVPEKVEKLYTGYKIIAPIIVDSVNDLLFEKESVNQNIFYITSRKWKNGSYSNDHGNSHGQATVLNSSDIEVIKSSKELSQQLAQASNNKLFFYVHGFKTPFDTALHTAAKIKKETQFAGSAIAYSWPSKGQLVRWSFDGMLSGQVFSAYHNDQKTTLKVRPHLKNTLQLLRNSHPETEIFLIAHSMGTDLLVKALKEIDVPSKKFTHLILIASDLTAETFNTSTVSNLKTKIDKITIYVSENDVALKISKYIQQRRLGALNSFGHPNVIIKGVDAVDASIANSTLFHSHHNDPRIMSDIGKIFQNIAVNHRSLIADDNDARGRYWKVKYAQNQQKNISKEQIAIKTTPVITEDTHSNLQRKILFQFISPTGQSLTPDKVFINDRLVPNNKNTLLDVGVYTLKVLKKNFFPIEKKIYVFPYNNTPLEKEFVLLSKKITTTSSQIKPGFTYLRTQTYTCNGNTYSIQEYRHNRTGMEFVKIPGGSFTMGGGTRGDEKSAHGVTLDSFLISKTEVTQGVWQKIMGTTPWKGKNYIKESSNYAATCVSWNDAKKFCNRVGLQLPTEAQWEYACRSGSSDKYYWGNNMDGDYAWYGCYIVNMYPHQVAQKKPNAFGLYDMSGNVWEWCHDWYDENYYSSCPTANPKGPNSGFFRINRGGGWFGNSDNCRSRDRSSSRPDTSNSHVGFRPSVHYP